MHKNIEYHTRAYRDSTVRLTGGSFGGHIDQETVEGLTRLFSVTVLPSGTPIFVDRHGREVRLYITVDACNTTKGKEALKAWHAERARLEAEEAARTEPNEAEIADLISGLSHDEIVRRLKGL